MKKLKILLADDHSIVRRGLKDILMEEFQDAEFIEASDGQEVVRKMKEGDFDIVITDVSMPVKNGLDVLKILKPLYPKVPFLILSMHPEEHYAIRVLKAGASGYLTKESAPDELVKAVRYVLAGRKYISSSLAEKIALSIGEDIPSQPHESLSDREMDVLKMIAGGKTVSEIAGELNLSVNTISTYRSRILEKMKMKTNSELTYYAISNHLI